MNATNEYERIYDWVGTNDLLGISQTTIDGLGHKQDDKYTTKPFSETDHINLRCVSILIRVGVHRIWERLVARSQINKS